MNAMFKKTVCLGCLLFGVAVTAEEEEGWVFFNDGGWHVRGGVVWDFGVKSDLRCFPPSAGGGGYSFTPGMTAAEAADLAKNGRQVSATKRVYVSGSWIDVNDDTSGRYGRGSHYTGYYHIKGEPGQVNDGSVFSLGTVEFSELRGNPTAVGQPFGESDRHTIPGFTLELDRTLYRDSEHSWGVDLGFAFQYFRRLNLYRQSRSWSGSGSVYEGAYEGRVDTEDAYISDNPSEDFNWGNGYYGVPEDGGDGSYAGVINADGVYSSLVWSRNVPVGSRGSMASHADYENMEFMFLARPYYDVTDWFRLVGTLGVVVSRHDLEFTASMTDGGTTSHFERNFSEWDVYGVAGLGAAFRYKDFTLGVDFLARFLDDDLNVRSDYVRGSVERGDWMFRVMLGYDF